MSRWRVHFKLLTPEEQTLVNLITSGKWTKKGVMARLRWSDTKFYNLQRSLIDKGWPLKPTRETVTIVGRRGRSFQRPVWAILKEEEDYIHSNLRRTRAQTTAAKVEGRVLRQGERDNNTSQVIYNAEQQQKVTADVLEAKPTGVPVGHSANDPKLKVSNGGGDHVLTQAETEMAVAELVKKHPKYR